VFAFTQNNVLQRTSRDVGLAPPPGWSFANGRLDGETAPR
jgi:hypothetical protein